MNQNDHNQVHEEDLVVLGVASVETRGTGNGIEGVGQFLGEGISEE